MTRVAMVYGQWGQNIGNAFFNIGGRVFLADLFGQQPALVQDMPGYWTLHRKSKGNFSRWYDWISALDIDYLVVQGPFLHQHSRTIWQDTAAQLGKRGVQFVGLSLGFFHYSRAEIDAGIELIRAFPFKAVSTRDDLTFQILSNAGLAVPVIRGIDSSTFMHHDVVDVGLDRRAYIALSMDRYPEPNPAQMEMLVAGSDPGRVGGLIQRRLAGMGQTSSLVSRLAERRRPSAGQVGDLEIVRLDHRTNPLIPPVTYGLPNSIASDEPYSYHHIYRTAKEVVTDRVHGAAIRLAAGGTAIRFAHTPRGSLLDVFSEATTLGSGWELRRPDVGAMKDRQAEQYEALGAVL